MNRQQYNDEELYQKIMAELDSGAAEYDRLMASGEAPAKRKKATAVKWYAAAAAVAGLLIVSTAWFLGQEETDNRHMANTGSVSQKKEHLAAKDVSKQQAEKTDSDIHRLTASLEGIKERQPERKPQPVSPTPYIYTAMLPEVEFCPEAGDDVRSNTVNSNNVRLPQIRKERSFTLVCNVSLPDITAYADSTIFTSGTELMVACDEICYNDSNF